MFEICKVDIGTTPVDIFEFHPAEISTLILTGDNSFDILQSGASEGMTFLPGSGLAITHQDFSEKILKENKLMSIRAVAAVYATITILYLRR